MKNIIYSVREKFSLNFWLVDGRSVAIPDDFNLYFIIFYESYHAMHCSISLNSSAVIHVGYSIHISLTADSEWKWLQSRIITKNLTW